jgi:hypothetical protein
VISAADLRTYLRLETPEDAYELEAQIAELEDLDARAVSAAEGYCDRYFGPPISGEVVVLAGGGARELYLPSFASDVSAVSSRGYPGDTETVIEADADDGWALQLVRGWVHGNKLIRSGGGVWTAGTEYLVTADIGYAAGEEPGALRQAVLWLCDHFYDNRNPVVIGTIANELPQGVQELLAPFRRMSV